MQMGVDGRGWVRTRALGPRAHSKHKNEANGGHSWSHSSRFGSYGRGNFPGHDVLCVLPEMAMNEFVWVFVHMDGCIGSYGNGREKKEDKKSPKRESMRCFVVCTRGKKRQKVGRSGHGDQRRSFAGIWGEKVVCGTQ